MNLSSDENLSDKSLDNDAFFEQPLNARRTTRKPEANSKRKKNLTGIEEESDFEFEMSRLKPSAASTPRISNDDDGSDDEDLGFDPKKPKATSSKLDFFDDILSGALSDSKRPATAAATAPQPAARRRDERRPAVSRQSTDTTTDNSTAQRPKTSTGRRGSGYSTINNPDPLGLFSQPAKEAQQNSALSVSASKKRGSTADWLGLSVAPEPTIEDQQHHMEPRAESPKTPRSKPISQAQAPAYDILKLNDTLDVQDAADTTLTMNEAMPVVGAVDTAGQRMLQLNNMTLETRSAFNMLQQQESQLTLAAQMKQQERALHEMQRRQETLLQQQERQFETLMQQQIQRQQNLEENIKLQQQRINAHIQLMLTQPATALNLGSMQYEESARVASTADVPHEELTARNEIHAASQTTLERLQIETDSRRLELEKLRLEELIVNTKSNYEREIDTIEATYKKQIKLLDEHAEILESRLRAEITGLTEHYKLKIATSEEEQHKTKASWETALTTLKQDHEDELRRVRKAHEEDLELLRDEQRRMLETVQRTKMLEFAAVQDNSSYLDTLKAASANLSEATTDLQGLKEQLQIKLETANQEKQQTLDARERLLADKERRLQLCEASAEQEKARLMKLVANLEQQLTTLNKETSDENWQLRLKLSALEAEKLAFEREREYAREQMQRDEQRLSALKAEQIAEMQRVKLELQEERRQLQLAKTKFETQQKLRTANSCGLEKERCDLEVAMRCAHDAARQADDERQRYFSQHCELEQQKRELVDKETALRAKHEQLNMEMKACANAEQQAKDATKRARLIEQNLQEKTQTLQQRTRELAEKEAFLAEERQLLAQQRLAIKEVQQRLAQRQCANCQQLFSSASTHDSPRLENATKIAQDHMLPLPQTISPMYVVDRLLDDNIAESLKRLQASIAQQQQQLQSQNNQADISNRLALQQAGYPLSSTNLNLWPTLPPTGLDDDAKTLALSNFDNLQYEIDIIKSAAGVAAASAASNENA